MNRQFKLLLFLSTILFSCSTQRNSSVNEQLALDFCELPAHLGEKVRLVSSYSGIDEYWSLNPVAKKKCPTKLNIDLDFDKNYILPNKFQLLMTKVHNNYWNSYLIIDAIGVYETGKNGGYGHLGHNNSSFKIVEVLDMRIKKK